MLPLIYFGMSQYAIADTLYWDGTDTTSGNGSPVGGREIGIHLLIGLVMLQAQLTKLGEMVIMRCLVAQEVR